VHAAGQPRVRAQAICHEGGREQREGGWLVGYALGHIPQTPLKVKPAKILTVSIGMCTLDTFLKRYCDPVLNLDNI